MVGRRRVPAIVPFKSTRTRVPCVDLLLLDLQAECAPVCPSLADTGLLVQLPLCVRSRRLLRLLLPLLPPHRRCLAVYAACCLASVSCARTSSDSGSRRSSITV